MTESEKNLGKKIAQRKSGLEDKGLKMNTGKKTKEMFRCKMKDRVEDKGKWP